MKTDHKHVIRDLRLRFLMAKLWKENFFYILIININLTKISFSLPQCSTVCCVSFCVEASHYSCQALYRNVRGSGEQKMWHNARWSIMDCTVCLSAAQTLLSWLQLSVITCALRCSSSPCHMFSFVGWARHHSRKKFSFFPDAKGEMI